MVLLSSSLEETGRRGTVERADYLIDRFRVGYEFGGGWKCGCADFASSDACRHTREAAGRLAAQLRIAEHIQNGSLGSLQANGGYSPRPRLGTRELPDAAHAANSPRVQLREPDDGMTTLRPGSQSGC